MRRTWLVCVFWTVVAASALAQTPQPFPRAGQQPAAAAGATVPHRHRHRQPSDPHRRLPRTRRRPPKQRWASRSIPGAQFIASYDAGRGQRYYIFGSTATFNDLVTYYRTQLKDKGDLVFQDPPTQMFEIGKFNNETMAFPPGVTIKDYTSGGSQGYANPKPGAAAGALSDADSDRAGAAGTARELRHDL